MERQNGNCRDSNCINYSFSFKFRYFWLEAINAFSIAALVDTNDPRPAFHAAECYLQLGQLAEAENGFYGAKEVSANKSEYADLHKRAGIMLEAVKKRRDN